MGGPWKVFLILQHLHCVVIIDTEVHGLIGLERKKKTKPKDQNQKPLAIASVL
jgi:hypothetical protein